MHFVIVLFDDISVKALLHYINSCYILRNIQHHPKHGLRHKKICMHCIVMLIKEFFQSFLGTGGSL